MRSRSIGLLVTASAMIIGQTAMAAPSIAAQDNKVAPSPTGNPSISEELNFSTPTQKKEYRRKKLNMNVLHRLDCRLEGSSCAACLMSIKRTVDKLNGVYEIAVMLKKPYGFAVIYDSSKITSDKIMDAARKDKKATLVKFLDQVDEPMAAPPLDFILIPKSAFVK